ncbi:hypothetical protein Pint_10702 [Pistacia integerrima]|uniref:Uncharacterized protein n=1 Tax=Pistacia integerrima TaxID=434235 RepID=A0ACC0XK98_9ROSI|nr:hypothetical protein Pint_10702 [Pistacia integerrima]
MPTVESSAAERDLYARWEKSNSLSLIAMKRTIVDYLISGLPKTTNARVFLTTISLRFQVSNNVEAGNLMSALTEARYDSSKGVREFILRIEDI